MVQAASDIDEEMAGMTSANDSDEEDGQQPDMLEVGARIRLCCVTYMLYFVPQRDRDTGMHTPLAQTNAI